MSDAIRLPLKFQIGARTLAAVHRPLVRVSLSLDDAIATRLPMLPPLPAGAQGWLVTSLPVALAEDVRGLMGGMLAFERQRYTRYYVDLTIGADAWLAALSASTRSATKRKEKRVAARSGGGLKVTRHATPDEMVAFHPLARAIAARTYQERLLAAGLPDTPAFRQSMLSRAAAGQVRAWLLHIDDRPAAYLYCPVVAGDVIYEFLGHDPDFAELSPGSVLQVAALRDLFAEGGLKRFDFTEGEGQHKRQMATGGVECVDLLLLRPTLANRAVVAAIAGFDRAVALGKRVLGGDAARWLRRG